MSPIQNKPKSPTWRLRRRKDLGRATDGELVAAVEWLERAEFPLGAVVFIGVALELALALFHPAVDSLIGNWGPAIADVLVALGVLAVLVTTARIILYQGELTCRSNRRVSVAARMAGEAAERAAVANARAAEANERAVKAQVALEEYRAAHEARK
jgi:hypothetical protein